MSSTPSSNVLCLIAQILSLCTDASLDWSTSTTPLPRADFRMAIGHSSANLIYLFGGWDNPHQLVSFDPTHLDAPSPFIANVVDGLSHQVHFSGKGYTQIEEIIYMIHPSGDKFDIFNMSSEQFIYNYNNIIIPQIVNAVSCLAYIDHYLIITGGWITAGYLSKVQIFDLNSEKWILTANNMNVKRGFHGCVVNPQNKYLYVIAGRSSDDSSDYLDTVSKLYVGDMDHIDQYNWIDLEDTLRTPRRGCRSVIYRGDIFAIGGQEAGGEGIADVDIILLNDTIIPDNDLPHAVAYHSTVVTNKTLFVIGGSWSSKIRYDLIQYTMLSSEPNDYLFKSTQYEQMFTSRSISTPISKTKTTSITSDSIPFYTSSEKPISFSNQNNIVYIIVIGILLLIIIGMTCYYRSRNEAEKRKTAKYIENVHNADNDKDVDVEIFEAQDAMQQERDRSSDSESNEGAGEKTIQIALDAMKQDKIARGVITTKQ